MLDIQTLIKEYQIDGDSFRAIDNISLSFPKIQFVSILGPSGCGKTTLLNCIGGLDQFSSGDVLVDDKSLKNMDEKSLDAYRNNYIGFVFQNYYLIPQLTVFENIKVALAVRDYSEKEIDEKALKALKQVGLESIKNKKPNQLSGGQAQRVAIARSLVTDPTIILADEPTGALDSENSIFIMKTLKEISKKRLVIMVTHNEQLACEYSDRIIRMQDGRVISDEMRNKVDSDAEIKDKVMKRSFLSWKMTMKLAIKNMFSRKWKTLLTGVANSFGIVGIGFFLAVNNGFNRYSTNLSSASATSLPVVVSPYNKKTVTEKYSDINATDDYPSTDEIYPSVDAESQYSYQYNAISPKYLSYVNSLKNEGIVREYILSYGNDYSFNLCTNYPQSINGKSNGYLGKVKTTLTNYNYYASQANLPYNAFHVLYGDMDQYDVIFGQMAQKENELMLVVDEYNSVSFETLQVLGFYNKDDTQDDVQDSTLSTKVKPIKFSDIIGKTYKIFSNDEYYQLNEDDIWDVTDANGYQKRIYRYEEPELTQDFYTNHGKELKITGIIRPKETSPFSILGESLCYLPSLQEELTSENSKSQVSSHLYDNMVFVDTRTDEEKEEDGLTAIQSFVMELQLCLKEFEESKASVLPTTELNTIFNKYFYYYPFIKKSYVYIGFSAYFSDCRKNGVNLVSDSLLGVDLTDSKELNQRLSQLEDTLLSEDYPSLYSQIISLIAYANAYSQITSLVIFPVDLPSREKLISRLDDFNEIGEGSSHANSEKEQVYYVSGGASSVVKSVGKMISLASMILLIFAVVSLVVSCSMTALLTSNNVLERKKEIGLLRSLGTRKADVVRLFESEALVIGIMAGIIGSITTFVLSFPINALINTYYAWAEVGTICDFTWYHFLIVTVLSIFLGFISSLIPSIKASKENPVDALRSE